MGAAVLDFYDFKNHCIKIVLFAIFTSAHGTSIPEKNRESSNFQNNFILFFIQNFYKCTCKNVVKINKMELI